MTVFVTDRAPFTAFGTLRQTGYGYIPPLLDFLVVIPEAATLEGAYLADNHRTDWCQCATLEIILHPQENKVVGVKYTSHVSLCLLNGVLPPEQCHVSFFQDQSENFWREHRHCRGLSHARLEAIALKHRAARDFVSRIDGTIPESVLGQFRDAVRAENDA